MSSKQREDKQVYTEVITSQEGEIITSKTVYKTQSEPDFVKLYIDCVFTIKGVRKGINPIFLAFLERMSYASTDAEHGGQLIYVNNMMKKNIAEKLGLTLGSINKALYEIVKAGLFKRIGTGTYQVNPNIVGRGEWKDIKNIRAKFDFGNREVVAEIVKKEEDSMTDNQQKLSNEFDESILRNVV